jgi:hypothetical protein
MLEYQKDLCTRISTPTSNTITPIPTRHAFVAPSTSRAASAQASGHARLNSLARSLSASSLPLSPPPLMPLETRTPTAAEKEEAEWCTVIKDERIIDQELSSYEADGVIDENHPEFDDFGILHYWQVRPLVELLNS